MTAADARRRRALAAWLVLALVALTTGYAVWSVRTREGGLGGSPGVGSAPPTPGTPTVVTAAPNTVGPEGTCAPASADGIPQQPGTAEALPDPATARTELAALRVAPRSHGDTYCRGRFGPSTWPDLDRNGCSTRQDVLVRQATTVRTARIASHGATCEEAIAGTWTDPYTLEPITLTDLKDPSQAQHLQIDHLVPLYNAWVSGASEWTDARRVAFANDLAAPELRAVTGEVNFAKDHAGPESWQPVPLARCDYARAYVAVKARHALTVTAAERDALAVMLAACA